MDTLYNPTFYDSYQELLGAEPDQRLDIIRDLASELLEYSKTVGFKASVSIIIALLYLPLLVGAVWVYIRDGSSWVLAPLVLATLLLVYRRSTVSRMMAQIRKPNTDMGTRRSVQSLIRYISQGFDAKAYRADTLLYLYVFFFPCVMVVVALTVYGKPTLYMLLVWLTIAYIIAAPVWYAVFSREKNRILALSKQAELLQEEFYKLPK